MQELPHTKSCFVCGESNRGGLNLRFHTDGTSVTTHWTPSDHHVGFHGTVHGGMISTVLDEILVWACAVPTRRFAYCAELNVRFLKPLSPLTPTRVHGQLLENRRHRIFLAEAKLFTADDTLIATATGKYMPVPDAAVNAMLNDVVGNLAEFIEMPPDTAG